MIFSSLWCIKDRDPKQVERKVLSFQRHYIIPPPGVKARFTIFWFLLSFRYFGWKCEVHVYFVYAEFFVYSFFLCWCVGAVLRSPLRPSAKRWDTSPAGGGKCTGVNRGKVCGKARPKKRLSYHKVSLYLRACTWLPLRGSWREAPERGAKKRLRGRRFVMVLRKTQAFV